MEQTLSQRKEILIKMEQTLSQRKEILIKDIISLIKKHDFSKGTISFENKFNLNINCLFKIGFMNNRPIILASIYGKQDKKYLREEQKYKITLYYYDDSWKSNSFRRFEFTMREFKRLFNTLSVLDLFLIKLIIQQVNKT